MPAFCNSSFEMLENGNFSVMGICIGNTEEEAIEILADQDVSYSKEKCYILVRSLNFSENLPYAKIRYYVDGDKIIMGIYVSFEGIDKEVSDQEYLKLSSFFEQNKLTSQKETYSNDFENEFRYTNGICLIDGCRYSVPMMQNLGKENSFGVRISIHSHISIYHIPEEIKKASIRLSVPQYNKPVNNHKNLYSFIHFINKYKGYIVCLSVIILGLVGYITWPSSTNKIDSLYFEENDNSDVVYICTGETAKKYHKTPDCRWLDNCSGTIKEVSIEEAEEKHKTPCKGCYKQ